MPALKKLPTRDKVKPEDTWNLASLFKTDKAWEKGFAELESLVPSYDTFRGTLGESAGKIAACLAFDRDFGKLGERLGVYAFLRTAEDQGNSTYQGLYARYMNLASGAEEKSSYIRPELLAIPSAKMKKFLADPALAEFRILLERILRYKPHSLPAEQEKLLAMQTEMAQASNNIFRALNDVDLKFGNIETKDGPIELSHAGFSMCLHSPDRDLRRRAFHQYYAEYEDHAQTLSASLTASIQRDVFNARVRNYVSAREASLFGDNVPTMVYDSLIETVHKHLPTLYRYYDVRKRVLKLETIHAYDVYVPMVPNLEKKHTWDQAVKVVIEACAPLGPGYLKTLEKGLKGRWCDRYENKGKQSGAFSSGSFGAEPFILMNYQPAVLDHVFTLAHEAGHSMHSHHSAKHQPFQYYDYSIFVAEVASTFNEQLLSHYLMERAKTKEERAFYLNREMDAIRTTLVRQTMFAEFERLVHDIVEKHEPLTLDRYKQEYGDLLKLYFGPRFNIDENLKLECLRIPHFYRAFYVYKYSTGISAAIALANGVLNGGKAELEAYLGMLKSGCVKYPLDLLKDAGVDMTGPGPVDAALTHFGKLLDEFETLM